MAIRVEFMKSHAEYLLDCLGTGKPINPRSPMGWTGDDLLALAGACLCRAMSLDPEGWALKAGTFQKSKPEQLEVNLHAAIGLYAKLSRSVQDGQYDSCNEPESIALVTAEELAGQKFAPVKGFKGKKNLEDDVF
jgi:hypothetical protein